MPKKTPTAETQRPTAETLIWARLHSMSEQLNSLQKEVDDLGDRVAREIQSNLPCCPAWSKAINDGFIEPNGPMLKNGTPGIVDQNLITSSVAYRIAFCPWCGAKKTV